MYTYVCILYIFVSILHPNIEIYIKCWVWFFFTKWNLFLKSMYRGCISVLTIQLANDSQNKFLGSFFRLGSFCCPIPVARKERWYTVNTPDGKGSYSGKRLGALPLCGLHWTVQQASKVMMRKKIKGYKQNFNRKVIFLQNRRQENIQEKEGNHTWKTDYYFFLRYQCHV